MSTVFKGSGVALVTPFTNGEVDYTALTRLIELQIISGTDAIIVCGTTGEAATMTAAAAGHRRHRREQHGCRDRSFSHGGSPGRGRSAYRHPIL